MTKQKHVEFAFGFLAGVLLTIFCWRFLEATYIREILGVQPPAHRLAATAAPGTVRERSPQTAVTTLEMRLTESELTGSEAAPITLTEYSDFFCPYCDRVAPSMDRLMEQYPGKIHRVFRHFPLPFHTGSDRIHEASECAREQGKFWAFHHYVFSHQQEAKSPDFLDQASQKLSLNREALRACTESRKYESKVKQDLAEGSSKGVNGTPATSINGFMISGALPYEMFQQTVEHFLDSKKPLPQLPGLKPVEPKKPVTFTDLQGKPTLGNDKAPVTIVEFSDFHCPFCERAFPVVQQIMKAYDGKVRLVWRHFPLPMHAGAERTHIASVCAAEQNKFWPYHDKVFENQRQLSQPDILNRLAQETGLDMKAFQACVTNPASQAQVQQDVAQGRTLGVQGTPTFFINGNWFVGAQPYEAFDKAIQEALKKS